MVLLGLAVGKASTPVDTWVRDRHDTPARWLLFFTDERVVATLLIGSFVAALYRRRWRLAVLAVVAPALALVLSRLLKRVFGREINGMLAYPSGHITVTVVALGMLVLVAGVAWWSVLAASGYAVLAVVGQAVNYHYFTDTLGAVLLGTAVVCVAAELDRCQPRVRRRSQRELAWRNDRDARS